MHTLYYTDIIFVICSSVLQVRRGGRAGDPIEIGCFSGAPAHKVAYGSARGSMRRNMRTLHVAVHASCRHAGGVLHDVTAVKRLRGVANTSAEHATRINMLRRRQHES